MYGLFNRAIEDLTSDDLRNLVERKKIREFVNLDYKQESYQHNHSGTVDLLADVTAMANSRGGLIIIGVQEDSEAPDGTPKAMVGIKNGDEEVNWIQSVCLSSIDVNIPGIKVRDILIGEELYCVIIFIPDSPRKPHMVVHEKHRSFRVRYGRSNTVVGMEEVRQLIISMNSYQSSLVDFIKNRIEINITNANQAPFLLLMSTPIYISLDKINPLEKQYCELLEKVPGNPDNNYDSISVGVPRPRIYGIEAHPYGRINDDAAHKYLRLFRNGHFEYYENYVTYRGDQWPQKPMPIYSYRITISLLHFLNVAKQIYEFSDLLYPCVISLVLGNVSQSYLSHWKRPPPWMDNVYIWRESLIQVDISATTIDFPNILSSYILDRLFNAYGLDKNLHFDENYNLQKQ